MKEIKYILGDATKPYGEGVKVIAHVCNDMGHWGKGFVMALSKRWEEPKERYIKWYNESDKFYLGNIQLVKVEHNIFVANMIGQNGLLSDENKTPFDCDATRQCLSHLREVCMYDNVSVHMPRIGCGLGGAKWECVEKIIVDELCAYNIQVYVYDF